MSELVNPPSLAAPVGFSHAVRSGDTVYLAGQTAQGPDGRIVGETVAEQFGRAADNLLEALRAAGGAPQDLVSLQVFVCDVAEYREALPALGRAWRERFGRHYPAMGLFGVRELFDLEARIELMGVAVISSGG